MPNSTTTKLEMPRNEYVFCEYPWKMPVVILICLVILTFVWGFYVLETNRDDDYGSVDDVSVSDVLFRDVAVPDIQRLYDVVSPAVVGIGGTGVNAGVIGSGSIVSAGGYVLTTLHTVDSLPEIYIHVKTATGVKRYEAQIVKSHPVHDLVLLKMLTADQFMHFVLGDASDIQVGRAIYGFGQGTRGNTVVKQGTVLSLNKNLTADGMSISHLVQTDAVYSWEQNGGPVVNERGELVAVGLALRGPTGMVDGYAVPSNVIAAHFQDVVNFKLADAAAAAGTTGPAVSVPVAAPGSGPIQLGSTKSAAWWAQARAKVDLSSQPLGMNVAMGTGAPAAPAAGAMVDKEHLLQGRIAGFGAGDILGLALLALTAGITGGMMTMGGGLIQVAGMMAIFGYGMYLIRPVAYLTNIFVYGAAALRYNKDGLVMWSKVKALAPWAVIGVIAGYFIGNAIGDDAIATLLGVFALLMVAKALHEIFADQPDEILVRTDLEGVERKPLANDSLDEFIENEKRESRSHALGDLTKNATRGVPVGLVSGILGISGGVVAVPLQRFFDGQSLQNAIANSAVLVFWASIGGALVSFSHGISNGLIEWQAPLTLALFMVPGAYVGGILGAKLMNVLPVVALKWFYTAIMAAISVKMLFIT